MTLSPKGKDTVEFIWDRDSQYENSVSLDQGGGGVELGDASAPDAADFMLDQSELGGLTFTEVYADLEEGGDFRWIQYRFRQEINGDDLHLHAFSVGLQFDAFGTE